MTKSHKKRPPSGEIRQSQILSTFGPGSMVDLPDYSVRTYAVGERDNQGAAKYARTASRTMLRFDS